MLDNRNPKRSTGCHKAGNRPQCLQRIDATVRIRGAHQ